MATSVGPRGADSLGAAASGGLRHVTDAEPGIARRRAGKGFGYRDADGARVRTRQTLARIRALAIPPAWTDVWICPIANGHIQATGPRRARPQAVPLSPALARGARRDQVRPTDRLRAGPAPHPPTRARRPRARGPAAREGARHRRAASSRRRSSASATRSTRATNGSFGLTTLRDAARAGRGRASSASSSAARAASTTSSISTTVASRAIVRRCQDLPGHELFQYVDDAGRRQSIDSADVNDYLRDIAGHDFTAKDFRTWAGTVLASRRAAGPRRGERDPRPAADREGGRRRRPADEEHAHGLPEELHPSGDPRRLPGVRPGPADPSRRS